jgi:hypothetical protein
MAKLHARNRKELLRLEKYTPVLAEDKARIEWQRHTLAFMSDGNMLSKYDVRYLPSSHDVKGKIHSLGWKRKGKYTRSIEENRERFTLAGWKEVTV